MFVLNVIKWCVSQTLNIPIESVPTHGCLKEDLFVDSLDLLNIRFAIEDAFGIEFFDQELSCMCSIDSIYSQVKNKIGCGIELNYLLSVWSRITGEKIAFFDNNKCITYKHLYNEVVNTQEIICKIGIKEDSVIRLNVNDEIESFIIFFALMGSHISVIPAKCSDTIDYSYDYVIDKVNLNEKQPVLCHCFSCCGEQFNVTPIHYNVDTRVRFGAGQYINMTSGTSGSRKYCFSNWKLILENTEAVCRYYNMTNEDVFITLFPAHLHMHESCMRSLLMGGTSLIVDSFATKMVTDSISKHAATFIQGTPTQILGLCKKLSPEDTCSVRVVECCGGLLSKKVEISLRSTFTRADIVRSWGSSETTGVCISNYKSSNSCDNALGRIIPPYEYTIKGENPNEGELCICGGGVVEWVVKKNAIVKVDHWIETGDIVKDDNGNLLFLGRRTGMIKYAGENIFPEEIEEALCKVDGIADAIALGLFDDILGEYLVALVQLDKGCDISDIAIKKELVNNGLPLNKIPKRIISIASKLPYNIGGKKDRETAKSYFID